MLTVTAYPYDSPLVQELVAEVQQEYVVRYGSPDESVVDPRQFDPPAGIMLVATVDREPVAMGGFRDLSEEGEGLAEIKRMFVPERHRRKGYSRALLVEIEDRAREAGYTTLWLETGSEQPEAIALYESCGYEPIPDFGHYKGHPLTRTYGKRL